MTSWWTKCAVLASLIFPYWVHNRSVCWIIHQHHFSPIRQNFAEIVPFCRLQTGTLPRVDFGFGGIWVPNPPLSMCKKYKVPRNHLWGDPPWYSTGTWFLNPQEAQRGGTGPHTHKEESFVVQWFPWHHWVCVVWSPSRTKSWLCAWL